MSRSDLLLNWANNVSCNKHVLHVYLMTLIHTKWRSQTKFDNPSFVTKIYGLCVDLMSSVQSVISLVLIDESPLDTGLRSPHETGTNDHTLQTTWIPWYISVHRSINSLRFAPVWLFIIVILLRHIACARSTSCFQ